MRYHYFVVVCQDGITDDKFEEYLKNSFDNIGVESSYMNCTTNASTEKFKIIFPDECTSFSDQSIVAEIIVTHDGDSFEYVVDVLNILPNDSRYVKRRFVKKFTPRQARKITISDMAD